ncbi:hypothetical protein J4G33_00265 [Actinotalea sp. BY-33]|uniref:Uncharacterized protein n=1 Tax=Actinotalea soli TaxID=2819234 RepID=A0A939LMI6_9CELL|nr:hypothetical protein [Actinotalea soli]MBO1750231.1 hypothetical protein [Actinotalea soli]
MSAVSVASVSLDEDRAARARAVLAKAEERTGASRWVRPVRPLEPVDAEVPSSAARGAEERAAEEPAAGELVLPVPAHLGGLLPRAGLERGSTVVVAGSTSLALSLLVEASRAGGWVAVVGLPRVGVLAAHQLGLVLDRVALVPAPGPDGPTVVAALLDGVDVVVLGPQVALTPADRRRLSARARERGAVLLPTTEWPGAQVVLTAELSAWEGLGRGDGRLRDRRLVVRRRGRGTAAREHRAEVLLPARRHAVAPASTGLALGTPSGSSTTGTALREGRRAG